jgi:zinc protease
MSKKNAQSTKTKAPRLLKKKTVGTITEYVLTSNGMRVLFSPRAGTGVITSDIVYFIGSRHEAHGETGIAHMLEHMLFKQTTHDIAQKHDAAATEFEKAYGVVLNANTWRDRTSYFFSYPKEHFAQALKIEAERMRDVVITDESLAPEKANVLSEYDMHAGDELFTIATEMSDAAFRNHPYGHETIGYREDIEDYTAAKIRSYYERYYAPNNAVLIVVGDCSEAILKREVLAHFATLPESTIPHEHLFREPKQEGKRTVTVSRPSTKNILALGVKHEAFPHTAWFETMVIFDMLAGGEDSILNKRFVDTGLISHIDISLEQSKNTNLGIFFCTLSKKTTHGALEQKIRDVINGLTAKDIAPYLKKTTGSSLSFTGELVEYVSAGAWEAFFSSEEALKKITPKAVHARLQELFSDTQMTIGYFIGQK